MKCFFVFLLTLASLLSTVLSLALTVQPETLVGTPSLVVWTRDDTDVPPVEFDLRFVQAGADVGLALANIGSNVDDQFGNVLVTFPTPGQFALAAVTGNPPNTLIGMSNTITAIASVAPSSSSGSVAAPTPVPTAPFLSSSIGAASSTGISPTSTSSIGTSTPSTSASTSSTTASASTSSSTSLTSSATHSTSVSVSATATLRPISAIKQPANVTAIVAGILGTFLLIALLIALFLFLRHRRREKQQMLHDQRISFHKDMMVQPRDRNLPSLPALAASSEENLGVPPPLHGAPPRIDVDVERGFPLPPSSPSISTRGSRERASGPGPVPPSPIVGHLSPHPTRLGSGHIVPSPKGPRPSLKIKKTEQQTIRVTPPLRSAPVIATSPSTTTKPASAAAAAAVSTRTAKRTRRQRQITDRISMLSKQMAEVKVLFDTEEEEGKRGEHKRVLEDMQREMVWLRDQEEGAWALGLTDVSPPGWARYMTP